MSHDSVQDENLFAFLGALIANAKEAVNLGIQHDKVVWATENPEKAWGAIVKAINGLQTKEADGEPQMPLWERVNDTTIRVFLKAPIPLPFQNAAPEVWNDDLPDAQLVELREDGVYIDGERVTLRLAPGQKAKGGMRGYELRTQLGGKKTLHPNMGYALYQNPHLIHECWKVDEEGRTRFIYFWALGYRDSDGDLYVLALYWSDGRWRWRAYWLGSQWGDQGPAAILAS